MANDSREYRKTYTALKLIEHLFREGLIGKTVYRNILRDYHGKIDLSDFMDYK